MSRPRVPDWVRNHVPPPGWTNVFALVPSNDHLYGTETLFGDWDGQTLLLAKDGAPTQVIRALRDRGDPRPWRHAQRELGDPGGWKTNESIAAAAAMLPGGKLYGSATANLLCDDPRWSRSLPGFFVPGPLHDYLRRVLTWVLTSMPNVQRVACLGEEAWFLTSEVIGRSDVANLFSRHREAQQLVVGTCGGKYIAAHPLFHPAARVSDDAKRTGWLAMVHGAGDPGEGMRTGHGRPSPSAAHAPNDHDGVTGEWKDATFNRSPTITQIRDSPIRAQMVAILQKAGVSGVRWTAFRGLEWKAAFSAGLVYKAMKLVASRNGYRLQYKGDKTSPGWWRLAP